MLQRIQTLYLLIASVAMLLASVTPLAKFLVSGEQVIFEAMGVYLNNSLTDSTWALMTIGAITSVLALLTVFLYKGRLLQIRLTILNVLLMIGFYLYAGFLFYKMTTSSQLENANISVAIGTFMPLVAIITSIFAIRRIYADEALVRSLSRLR
ncbi:MAG: DUF4293 domain-containing protein [Dysgonamonadaceae bacterium]|nr:DUF4293 domain-containing protein [Dysgonamonadaceae bacterium]